MPFTFSHPAIVLPFKYLPVSWRSMTGLIIGSMAPDFEKFIRMTAYDAYSHTWKSIFYFNLPIALAVAFIFHMIIRDPLIDNLPAFLQTRVIRLKNINWFAYFRSNYWIVILSIIVGTVSHIAWDAFTHIDGRFVRWFPVLNSEVDIRGHEMRVYSFLQMGTSVLGLIIILYAFFRLPERPVLNSEGAVYRKLRYWAVFTLIALAIAVIRYVVGYHLSYLANFIVVAISASMLSLLITSYLFKNTQSPS